MTEPPTGVRSEDALDAFYSALLDDDPVALYEKAPCGYLSTLPDGTIVKANETFLTLSGYARHELIGVRTFADLLTAGGRIYHETHYAPMLHMQGTARAIALELVRADQTRLAILVNAVLERDTTGQPVVIRTAVFDATDRREYERELLRAKERAEASEQRAIALARTLQQTLIPPVAPSVPGLDVAVAYRPAGNGSEVGGDFYDIFEVGHGDWVVAIGDVQGKGIAAAAVTALARHTIRAAAVNQQNPSNILSTLNTVLLADPTERFCTVAVARLRQVSRGWTATTCCAGHPPPLLCRSGRAPEQIPAAGSLLGVLVDPVLTDRHQQLHTGDSMVLYTDGVTEARSPTNEFFGEERLVATIATALTSAGGLVARVLAEVVEYQAGNPRDDVAIVAITVL